MTTPLQGKDLQREYRAWLTRSNAARRNSHSERHNAEIEVREQAKRYAAWCHRNGREWVATYRAKPGTFAHIAEQEVRRAGLKVYGWEPTVTREEVPE